MMKMSKGMPKINGVIGGGGGVGCVEGGEKEWEVRPGGMLVQKRTDSDQSRPLPPPIRVRVKYGSISHEIYISSQSSFGELKKKLSGITGLHHQDQKLFYKDKERDSKVYLDSVGVKNKSKIVLMEDALSQEKRFLEMRKTATMEKSVKSVSDISLEVDRLAQKVSTLESIVCQGRKVVDKDVVELIESLMNQLLKLDDIFADGDLKLQKNVQVERVQKYVQILDVLKIKNSKISAPKINGNSAPLQPWTPTEHREQKHENGPFQPARNSNGGVVVSPVQHQQNGHLSEQIHGCSPSGAAVVITTQWETFESIPALVPSPHQSVQVLPSKTGQPSFTWNLL